jgi:ribosomal protein S27E
MSVSILPFDPNPDGTCRACRGALHPETWLCVRCGTAHGERNRCPHCRSVARTVPHPTLRHRCSVCGKPRLLPTVGTASIESETVRQLQVAGASQRVSVILSILGYCLLGLGLPGLLLTAVVLLILMPGLWVSGIALTVAVIPLLLWMFTRVSANRATRARDRAIEQSYSQAILASLCALSTELDAESIAQLIGLPLEHTEKLLTRLNADERMTSRVTDEGNLLYGATQPARVRIADLTAAPGTQSTAAVALGRAPEAPAQAVIDAEFDESGASELRRKT